MKNLSANSIMVTEFVYSGDLCETHMYKYLPNLQSSAGRDDSDAITVANGDGSPDHTKHEDTTRTLLNLNRPESTK